jgi:hypothetical protein
MMYRMLSVAMMVAMLLLVASMPMAAQDKADTHTGKFLGASGNSFKMEHPDGTEHSHKLALDAKVIGLDGKDAKLADFRKGQAIRVTTKAGDKTTATKVEAIKGKE